MSPREVGGLAELRELVGREAGVSDWFDVTQERVAAFADVTGDRQWIHLDRERARAESPYGTTVAHGFLTLSLLSHLHGQAVRVVQGRQDARKAVPIRIRLDRGPQARRATPRRQRRAQPGKVVGHGVRMDAGVQRSGGQSFWSIGGVHGRHRYSSGAQEARRASMSDGWPDFVRYFLPMRMAVLIGAAPRAPSPATR